MALRSEATDQSREPGMTLSSRWVWLSTATGFLNSRGWITCADLQE